MENNPKKFKPSGQRQLSHNVKTAKGRKLSSTLWLHRQLNDPYVIKAKKDGYRCRSTYKLHEIQDKFNIFHNGHVVVDLGCAPGGWCQAASEFVYGPKAKKEGNIIGIDLQEIKPLPGVHAIQGDFTDPEIQAKLYALINNKVDIVMSDMSPSSCGNPKIDHLRSSALADEALYFAKKVLKKGGSFITKILQGGEEPIFYRTLQKDFKNVRRFKPDSSRSSSTEIYLIAQNYIADEDN